MRLKEETFGMPPGSEILGQQVGEWLVFRWPAPANWYERLGPDRMFWLASAVFIPCAVAASFVDPIYGVGFLFAVLFSAGACGGRWRTTGFEEIAFGADALMVRRGKTRGGVIPGMDQPAGDRAGLIRRQNLELSRIAGRPAIYLSDDQLKLRVGAGLKGPDLDWLFAFIRSWAQG